MVATATVNNCVCCLLLDNGSVYKHQTLHNFVPDQVMVWLRETIARQLKQIEKSRQKSPRCKGSKCNYLRTRIASGSLIRRAS